MTNNKHIKVPFEKILRQSKQAEILKHEWDTWLISRMKELGLVNTKVTRIHDSYNFEVPLEELEAFQIFAKELYDKI